MAKEVNWSVINAYFYLRFMSNSSYQVFFSQHYEVSIYFYIMLQWGFADFYTCP